MSVHCIFSTDKPVMYIANVDEASVNRATNMSMLFVKSLHAKEQESVVVSGKIEAELSQLAADERTAFLSDLGLMNPDLNV